MIYIYIYMYSKNVRKCSASCVFFNLIALLLEIIYSLYLFSLSFYQKSSILKTHILKYY